MQNSANQKQPVLHFIGDNVLWGVELPYFALPKTDSVATNDNDAFAPVPKMAPPRPKKSVAEPVAASVNVVSLFKK